MAFKDMLCFGSEKEGDTKNFTFAKISAYRQAHLGKNAFKDFTNSFGLIDGRQRYDGLEVLATMFHCGPDIFVKER